MCVPLATAGRATVIENVATVGTGPLPERTVTG